jgi:cell division protein FtsB
MNCSQREENIYWNSTMRTTAPRKTNLQTKTPRVAALAIVASIAFMLCLSINYRAFCEMSREVNEHQDLSGQVETLKDENLALQEEIHNLKTDSESIRREARRLGIIGGNEQSPVSANK